VTTVVGERLFPSSDPRSSIMHVTLSAWHEQTLCTWCEKDREGVTVTFDDGFLKDSPLCWSCLQKAVKVRSRRTTPGPNPTASKTNG
jgi:hypothetical protein